MTLSEEKKDRDMVDLARAAKIGSEGKNVVIDLQFPIAQAISKIDEESDKRAARHKHKAEDTDSDETPKEKS